MKNNCTLAHWEIKLRFENYRKYQCKIISAIEVSNLTKYYALTLGIENVTFSVERGEIFGFLGPNGAGKTTTIRLLIDLLRPTSGSIELFGMSLKRNHVELIKRIGYLPGDF